MRLSFLLYLLILWGTSSTNSVLHRGCCYAVLELLWFNSPLPSSNCILSMFWAQPRMILMWMRLYLSPGSGWGQPGKCWTTGAKRKKYNWIHDSVCSKVGLKEKVQFIHSEGPEEGGTRQCFPSPLVPLEPELGQGALVGPKPSLGWAGWPALL